MKDNGNDRERTDEVMDDGPRAAPYGEDVEMDEASDERCWEGERASKGEGLRTYVHAFIRAGR